MTLAIGTRLSMIAAAALASVSGIPQGVAARMGIAPSGSPDMRPVKHRYQKNKPITRKNIGLNWYKSGMTRHGTNGSDECSRRMRQIENYANSDRFGIVGPMFVPIKITPRRPGDFTSPVWGRL